MAFVNEQIPEIDQKQINYTALKDPQTGTCISDLPRWTVDRERDVFLLRLGGGMSREDYHVPFYFLFGWNGALMRIDAFRQRMSSANPMLGIVTWEVIRMHLPEALTTSLEEIMDLLTEALDVHGSNSYDDSRAMLSEVQVDFSKLDISKFDFANIAIVGNKQ